MEELIFEKAAEKKKQKYFLQASPNFDILSKKVIYTTVRNLYSSTNGLKFCILRLNHSHYHDHQCWSWPVTILQVSKPDYWTKTGMDRISVAMAIELNAWKWQGFNFTKPWNLIYMCVYIWNISFNFVIDLTTLGWVGLELNGLCTLTEPPCLTSI